MKDPICGMTVEPDYAPRAERNGQTFYFCSEDCRGKFLSAHAAIRSCGPCAIVIFGASGDLTRRKLLPSLYNLAAEGILGDDFAIIGVARREWTREIFIRQLRDALTEFSTREVDAALWAKFEERIHFCHGSFDEPETYEKLKTLLGECEKQHHTGGNALFYLSVQPVAFASIARQLGEHGLVTETTTTWRRVIIEKPFGRDLASARELTSALSNALQERQIYRIDHYLGKETARRHRLHRQRNGRGKNPRPKCSATPWSSRMPGVRLGSGKLAARFGSSWMKRRRESSRSVDAWPAQRHSAKASSQLGNRRMARWRA